MRKISLLNQVKKEYADLYLQTIQQEIYEKAIDLKYFKKLNLIDDDIVFRGSGRNRHKIISQGYDTI